MEGVSFDWATPMSSAALTSMLFAIALTLSLASSEPSVSAMHCALCVTVSVACVSAAADATDPVDVPTVLNHVLQDKAPGLSCDMSIVLSPTC